MFIVTVDETGNRPEFVNKFVAAHTSGGVETYCSESTVSQASEYGDLDMSGFWAANSKARKYESYANTILILSEIGKPGRT